MSSRRSTPGQSVEDVIKEFVRNERCTNGRTRCKGWKHIFHDFSLFKNPASALHDPLADGEEGEALLESLRWAHRQPSIQEGPA